VDIALLLAVCGTWLGLLGRYHWTLDLFSHFRWQYFILCLFGVAWSRARKRRRIVQAIVLVSLLVNAAALYHAKGDPAFASTIGTRLRVVSLNVNIANQHKSAVLDYLRAADPDVIVLIEVDGDWTSALESLRATYPLQLFAPRGDNFGLAFLSRVPIRDLRIVRTSDHATPSVLARLTLDGRELAILATHPPPPMNGEMAAIRDAGLHGAAALVARLKVPVLLIGDLNTTPWSQGMRLLRDGSNLDFRSPDAAWTPTWNALTPFAIPIDHALVTPPLVVASRHIGPGVGSDHRPQVVEIGWQ